MHSTFALTGYSAAECEYKLRFVALVDRNAIAERLKVTLDRHGNDTEKLVHFALVTEDGTDEGRERQRNDWLCMFVCVRLLVCMCVCECLSVCLSVYVCVRLMVACVQSCAHLLLSVSVLVLEQSSIIIDD